jgi:hypothetical protein
MLSDGVATTAALAAFGATMVVGALVVGAGALLCGALGTDTGFSGEVFTFGVAGDPAEAGALPPCLLPWAAR